MRSKLNFILAVLLILTIPLISAYNGYGYDSLSDILNNEWVIFTLVFLALFGIMYFAMYKPYTTTNKPLIAVISASLSLLITITLLRRGFLYSYTGDTLGDWMIIIGFLIAAIALFKFLKRYFRKWWWLIGIILIIVFFIVVDMFNVLPESLQYGPVGDFIEIIEGFSKLILIGVIGVLIIWKIKKRFRRGGGSPQQSAQPTQQEPSSQELRKLRALERKRTADRIRKMRARY